MTTQNIIENAYLYIYVPTTNEQIGGICCQEGTIEQIRHEKSAKKWKARFSGTNPVFPNASQLNLRYGPGEISWLAHPKTHDPYYLLWLPNRDDERAKTEFEHCFRYRVSTWARVLNDLKSISGKEIIDMHIVKEAE